jgi:hypothetical protein
VAADVQDLSQVLAGLRGKQCLELWSPPHRVEVRRATREEYQFTLRPAKPSFWRNYTLVSTETLSRAQAHECLAAARAGDLSWVHAVEWHAPRKRRQGLMAGLIAFAVFGVPYAVIGGYSLYTKAPGLDAKSFWIGLIAVAVIASYIAWLDFFFGRVRKGIAERVSRGVGAQVRESLSSLDAGTWHVETPKGASFAGVVYTNLLVGVIDIVVLLLGTVLPVAVVTVSLFLLFDK